ncbi:O-methyltransferase [Jeotgalibacillus sp. ET6]|uniref:O-methyltransferase n=1 Tax=Jeotgalibacillus sp. ET6 TaxID=3037260 RepID=UPI00241888BE|nr:O-methyltransferase [Jeotgalibacillus sp. ET6]MDG5470895.1 O-methyltransferase [Jeotgalibacillus sp. ET6]
MNKKVYEYIEKFYKDRPAFFTNMEEYADDHDVPIMELDGMETLLQWLRFQQPLKILEVGTAIGYSALRMADALPNVHIISIERDKERLDQANQFIKKFGKEQQITTLYGDALEIREDVASYGPFDAIFIDAAKSQYGRFFELYTPLLTQNGAVYTDNVLFKGLVAEAEPEVSRNVKQLLRKIDRYNHWLMDNKDFETVILPVGDGLAISKKR